MDELVKLLTQKTGISDAIAKQAIEVIVGFLKQKLPAPFANQMEGFLMKGEMPKAGGIMGMLSGLMGGKK